MWAQAARVEAMRAARRAAEAEADDEATDDEAEAAAEEDELLLAAGLHLSPGGCPLAAAVCSRQLLLSAERDRRLARVFQKTYLPSRQYNACYRLASWAHARASR